MSEQELREIDVKVALALGWEWHLRPLHPAGHDNTEWRLVLLSPKSQAYTEETGGWVRYNEPIKTEEFSYFNNRSTKGVQYRITHPDDIKHFERFSDWDRSCYYYRPGYRERVNPADFYAVPRYTTDPAAAEVLWREIDYREWDWSMAHYQQEQPVRYQATVGFRGHIGWRLFVRTSETSPYPSLCLAFLAVHEFAEESRPWRRLNDAEAEKATEPASG